MIPNSKTTPRPSSEPSAPPGRPPPCAPRTSLSSAQAPGSPARPRSEDKRLLENYRAGLAHQHWTDQPVERISLVSALDRRQQDSPPTHADTPPPRPTPAALSRNPVTPIHQYGGEVTIHWTLSDAIPLRPSITSALIKVTLFIAFSFNYCLLSPAMRQKAPALCSGPHIPSSPSDS